MYSFAFVMDQQVGLRSQALNYERVVSEDLTIHPIWVPVRYSANAGPISRIPGIPASVKGTLSGVAEIRRCLTRAPQPHATLWATWAAKSVPDLVSRSPAYLVMDMTPRQMEQMGELYGYTQARAQFMASWKRRATDRIYDRAAHFFPWSNWVAESLRADYGISDDRITVISPGVDTQIFRPDPAVRLGDGVLRLLFVGGDFQRKGGDLLLRWAAEARRSARLEIHVVTRDHIPELPDVIVHRGLSNNSADLVRIYQQSDLFVLPTRADCYSLVAMEAMACGLPVVISGLGGIPEIVADRVTGSLIQPGCYEALADALDALVNDPERRSAMSAAALSRAHRHFDSKANITRILDKMKSASQSVARHAPAVL